MKRLRTVLLTTVILLCLSVLVPQKTYAGRYTTVKGDSLYKISNAFNTDINTLMKDNGLTSTMLGIGQELYVNCDTYYVKRGDTLFGIAKKYGVTLSALRRANNIYTDYIYIGQTLSIPNATRKVTAVPTTSSYSAKDLDMLARLISAEAIGESYQAKVAVGAVVINRVESEQWPNTVKAVIYQEINGYYQFTPVANGAINKAADSDSLRAAKTALMGIDSTKGAMFYYDTSTTNSWILAKPVSVSIDNMVFAY